MVEEYTMWNVRISGDATVQDVTEKVAKKLDEKNLKRKQRTKYRIHLFFDYFRDIQLYNYT
jgi:hypothetical protein